jgi:hypothetical protein
MENITEENIKGAVKETTAQRLNREYRSCVSVSPYFKGGAEFMKSWHEICDRAETRVSVLINQLREMGVKAVHPNDGWVSRENNIPYQVHFCYPDFIDDINVGDKIALKRGYDLRFKADVVELFEVTYIDDNFGYINYGIKYSEEIYIYHEDGRLELTHIPDPVTDDPELDLTLLVFYVISI